MAMERHEAETALELMVDQYGLAGVLEMLAEVCAAKADHIRSNWQDTDMARHWDQASKAMLSSAGLRAVDVVSPKGLR